MLVFLFPFGLGLRGQRYKIPGNSHLNISFLFMCSAALTLDHRKQLTQTEVEEEEEEDKEEEREEGEEGEEKRRKRSEQIRGPSSF